MDSLFKVVLDLECRSSIDRILFSRSSIFITSPTPTMFCWHFYIILNCFQSFIEFTTIRILVLHSSCIWFLVTKRCARSHGNIILCLMTFSLTLEYHQNNKVLLGSLHVPYLSWSTSLQITPPHPRKQSLTLFALVLGAVISCWIGSHAENIYRNASKGTHFITFNQYTDEFAILPHVEFPLSLILQLVTDIIQTCACNKLVPSIESFASSEPSLLKIYWSIISLSPYLISLVLQILQLCVFWEIWFHVLLGLLLLHKTFQKSSFPTSWWIPVLWTFLKSLTLILLLLSGTLSSDIF